MNGFVSALAQTTGAFLLIFFVSAVILHVIDFYPEPVAKESAENTEEVVEGVQYPVEKPTRIVIERIGVDTAINNPTSTDIDTLDTALLSGAVRYPESALLGENATMFLFGHQSYLPVVRNQAFKAFNDLQNLEAGDTIRVLSETAEYEYAVASVELVQADEALIPLEAGARRLVLSTCDSFGKNPEQRYVVTADLVSRKEQ